MAVHIHVVTPIIPTGLTQSTDFEKILFGDDTLTFTEISSGPASVETNLDIALAVPATVGEVIAAEEAGVSAVVIDCMSDPGLQAARECVSIPVLGPCETSMNIACMLGSAFCILNTTAGGEAEILNQARIYGASEKYRGTRSINTRVQSLMTDPNRLQSQLLMEAEKAVEVNGADVLVLGCTGMINVAGQLRSDLLEEGYDVQVIDPLPATVRVAKMLVESNLSHSKIRYPTPSRKVVKWPLPSPIEKFFE